MSTETIKRGPGPLLHRLRRHPQRRHHLPQRLRALRGPPQRRREPAAGGHRFGALGGRVVEAELPVARAAGLHRDGHLDLYAERSHQLEEILATLVAEAEQLRELAPAAA